MPAVVDADEENDVVEKLSSLPFAIDKLAIEALAESDVEVLSRCSSESIKVDVAN